MTKQLFKFTFDKWIAVAPDDLNPGDFFSYGNTTAIFKSLSKNNGEQLINAEPFECGPIRVCLGETGSSWEYIVRASDYVGSSFMSFDDGTTIIGDFEDGKTAIYSPRLQTSDLNLFCHSNMSVYEKFYDRYADSIDEGICIEMNKFW